MNHTDYQQLLAAYALEAIDPSDGRALGEHLVGCPECRAELSDLREAAGLLAHGVPPQTPSPSVRDRILSAVRAESSRSEPIERQSNVVPLAQRRKPAWSTQLLRIAAVLILVAAAFVLVSMILIAQHKIAELTAEVEAQKSELNREHEARLQDQKALALLASRDARMIQLTGTPTAKDSSAMFVFDPKSHSAVLLTQGLPVTPADKAYEVWFIPKGKAPMRGKVFTVDPAGHAMITDQMPAEAMTDAVIAITMEPKAGSDAPTGAIYLASPAS